MTWEHCSGNCQKHQRVTRMPIQLSLRCPTIAGCPLTTLAITSQLLMRSTGQSGSTLAVNDSDVQQGSNSLARASDRIREAAKWLIVSFAAVGVTLYGGLQLASIGKLSM